MEICVDLFANERFRLLYTPLGNLGLWSNIGILNIDSLPEKIYNNEINPCKRDYILLFKHSYPALLSISCFSGLGLISTWGKKVGRGGWSSRPRLNTQFQTNKEIQKEVNKSR